MTLEVGKEFSSNANSDGVRHRAMPEQENKGRVLSPALLHPGREGGRKQRGCLRMIWGEAVKTHWKKERM